MKLHVAAVGLIALSGGLVSSRPQEAPAAVEPVADAAAPVVADAAPVAAETDAEAPAITEEELQKEEELEDYYDYTWKEQLMAPVRNVGQMLSGGVKGAAESSTPDFPLQMNGGTVVPAMLIMNHTKTSTTK